MHPPISLSWHPLDLFDGRFRENLSALATHNPKLAERLAAVTPRLPFFIAAQAETVFIGRPGAAGIEIVPDPLPPAQARRLLASLFPKGEVSWPILIGGLAYGWAWDRIAKLPCKVETAPGHKPPVYLLAGDIEQLWAVLHVMDWRQMLADPRFAIFAGSDAVNQLADLLVEDPMWSRPRASVRIESGLWSGEFDALMQSINARIDARTAAVKTRLSTMYPADWLPDIDGGPLRVMGITSRYTTFLQHSMRDWLEGFERLGHETTLLIDPADHLIRTPLAIAESVAEFRPDLIVIIDHYRAEIPTLPESVPCVMYVQDRMPNMYCAEAGARQKPRDYCLGFSKLFLSARYGYPAERFMPAPVGINEHRFARAELSAADLDRFGCDVSYVSNASRPAADLMREQAARSGSPQVRKLFDDLYQRMDAWYAAGGQAFSEILLRSLLAQSMQSTGVELQGQSAADAVTFFNQVVNNAMFRHQTLGWLAAMDVNLHLWGAGWEKHPTLARYARGVADNQRDLPQIYRASRINLQVTPHGSVHQRLLDGLAAGGFFLLRWHPGDAVGLLYRELQAWCDEHDVTSDAQLHERADARVRDVVARINRFEGSKPQTRALAVTDVMRGHADTDFTTSADSIWPEYAAVSFDTGLELEAKVARFLADEDARADVARSMRAAVIGRFSYTTINRRLLEMIRENLAAERKKCAA